MDTANPEQSLPRVLRLPVPYSPLLVSSFHRNDRQRSPGGWGQRRQGWVLLCLVGGWPPT